MSRCVAQESSAPHKLPMEELHMRTSEFRIAKGWTSKPLGLSRLFASVVALLLLPACSVNVRKEGNGQDKQVDIKTLLGGIHVSKDADVADTGLAVYPGAHLKERDSGNGKSANVNISGFGYGVRVIALEDETDDSPTKLEAFYKEQLKKYGSVLECRTSSHLDAIMKGARSNKKTHELTCDRRRGTDIEPRGATT